MFNVCLLRLVLCVSCVGFVFVVPLKLDTVCLGFYEPFEKQVFHE